MNPNDLSRELHVRSDVHDLSYIMCVVMFNIVFLYLLCLCLHTWMVWVWGSRDLWLSRVCLTAVPTELSPPGRFGGLGRARNGKMTLNIHTLLGANPRPTLTKQHILRWEQLKRYI